ncbi:PPPDE peptidase domain-containing protein [Dioscorea alata]|uniref:PPPDE peptidase domain-containing protein n=1 Tax=Dioscorea alata TaxID=55571 RepID=A0ACB7WKB5_DIOAL|nr:PPPDE peptidase domain-containing protein [Dioscorea alata]
MLGRVFSSKRRDGSVPVYLNVYDLTPINGYAYWLGLGVYHSGVQVHGVEYAYGAHENPTTGIFEGEPRQCPGFAFRKSILIGRTDLGPRQVRELMETLAETYTGSSYNLISKNCNHFCDEVCLRLTSSSIPRWVNRLARLGFLCNCVLPAGISMEAVRRKGSENTANKDGEKRKLRSNSSRCIPSTAPPPPTPSTTTTTTTSNRVTRVPSSRRRKSSSQAPPLVGASPAGKG